MRYLTLLLLLALFLTGCNAPTATRQPTQDLVATQVAILQTSLPTATIQPPAASATPEPSATAAAATATTEPTATLTVTATTTGELKDTLGEPAWSDMLDSGKNFYLFENEGTRVTFDNGALAMAGLQSGWLGWSLTYSRQPQNFYVEATFITQDCSGNDRYGIMFRATNSTGYFFGVTCSGAYNLGWSNFDTSDDKALIQSTSSPAIVGGANQTNRLGVMANGDKLSLYANGKLLQEFTDTTMTDKGYNGAFVQANQTIGFTIKLDEIKLWNLP